MCGMFHALVMPAAAFIVGAGSTNDDSVVNLAHDVTDLAPARQRRVEGAKTIDATPRKWLFLQRLNPAEALNHDTSRRPGLLFSRRT